MLFVQHVSDFGRGPRRTCTDALHVRQGESHAQPVVEDERVHAGESYRNPLVLDGHPFLVQDTLGHISLIDVPYA